MNRYFRFVCKLIIGCVRWSCFSQTIRVADVAAAKGPVLSLLFLADNSRQMPSHAEASGSASPAATRLKHNPAISVLHMACA